MKQESQPTEQNKQLRIAFIHPDLGIGGAEQLIINLALAYQKKGHSVKIYTPFHDKKHCFKETSDGTIEVEVRGSCFPRHIFKKCVAFCAYIRMMLAALYVVLFGGHFDLVVVDQVSFCVPILRFFRRKVLFYCHFPDKLLCVERRSIFKKIYRFFLDFLEEITLYPANLIVVNSKFTQGVFARSFKILNWCKIKPDVLYPATDFDKFDENIRIAEKNQGEFNYGGPFFLSLNRYERKKNINLAIQAFAEFKKLNSQDKFKLVIAGGYEQKVEENVQHKQELENLAKQLNVEAHVIFRTSVSDQERCFLLKNAIGVLYTPENEHFGIVPVEAMYMERPIIACKSGGPLESVKVGAGFLLDTDAKQWGEKLQFLASNEQQAIQMGKTGKIHAKQMFGLDAFADFSNQYAFQIVNKKQKKQQ